VPIVGAPQLDREVTGETLVLVATLFTGPGLVGLIFEMVALAATDRVGRRPMLVGALLTMAVCSWLMAGASQPVLLSLAFGVWGIASGVATGLGQAALVSHDPEPERAMARWGIAAEIGDLLAVLLVVGLEAGETSWRVALVASSLLPLLDGLVLACSPALPVHEQPERRRSDRGAATETQTSTRDADQEEQSAKPRWRETRAPERPIDIEDPEEEEPFGTALREAVTDWRLLAWLLAAASCTLMDEIVVVMASLHLTAMGAPAWLRGVEIGAMALGGMAGLALTERYVSSWGSRPVLLLSAALTVGSFLGWLAAGASPIGIGLAVLFGAGVGPMYPLAKAAAYARRPDRPGLVGALDHLFVPLDLAAPVLLGLLSDRLGLQVALLALLVQPLVVASVALISGRSAAPR
jgi:MFS family permease